MCVFSPKIISKMGSEFSHIHLNLLSFLNRSKYNSDPRRKLRQCRKHCFCLARELGEHRRLGLFHRSHLQRWHQRYVMSHADLSLSLSLFQFFLTHRHDDTTMQPRQCSTCGCQIKTAGLACALAARLCAQMSPLSPLAERGQSTLWKKAK